MIIDEMKETGKRGLKEAEDTAKMDNQGSEENKW